jgi:hypothetical protein
VLILALGGRVRQGMASSQPTYAAASTHKLAKSHVAGRLPWPSRMRCENQSALLAATNPMSVVTPAITAAVPPFCQIASFQPRSVSIDVTNSQSMAKMNAKPATSVASSHQTCR